LHLLFRSSAILLGVLCAALLAVGCGGGGGDSSSSVSDVTACIEEAGLQVESLRPGAGEEIGVEDTLKVTLPAGEGERPNGIVVSFFESKEAAAEQADAERTFLEGAGAGGSVEQHGSVVVSVARSGNEKEFEQVQDCL
jgi:hypothetical protein